ncbi:tryptophan 7-halogenase [Novosphingobium sp. KCTC 2891]|uniref:tryptophan halogenase family protein n=1 Tax=Novosphingobium sp. KCTC 2891 TaxID=2989730 RepID=UPI002223847B|nr:tryptophan halogenase family protein [Novosphingobium sp. KCTC 2891]MCW1383758.1 tryptophan 7-halogenase [Novosphingobium sp. KCTC 2891]
MTRPIRKVVILGGGTAGWMTAALLAKVLGPVIQIELVESDDIGIIGVGEATIPPIQQVNAVLGIAEADFLRETRATIKLAIRFENWGAIGDTYYHTFGAAGRNTAFCSFHHFWARARKLGFGGSYWDYDLNALSADAGKFAPTRGNDPVWDMPYAYHFDSGLYGQFLRRYSENLGVVRTEGMVADVQRAAGIGDIMALVLRDGRTVSGDLFVDCSGSRGVLIQQHLGTGYEDWSHWLPCDRAMAVPSERFEHTLPFTRAIAHEAGWQWRIPLQHRNGNGLVYSSRHYTDDQAAEILLGNLGSKALADPKVIPFRTGRARRQWNRNVVAVGLSSGFLEPLESTSIYLIQSAITRLMHLFPHQGITPNLTAEYNRQSQIEMELIRDFIILHYHANARWDSAFWRDLRNMDVPERLARKIELFRSNGTLVQDQYDIFLEPSWVQVLLGQGIQPADYHPLADGPSDDALRRQLSQLAELKVRPLAQLPSHDAFLQAQVGQPV